MFHGLNHLQVKMYAKKNDDWTEVGNSVFCPRRTDARLCLVCHYSAFKFAQRYDKDYEHSDPIDPGIKPNAYCVA